MCMCVCRFVLSYPLKNKKKKQLIKRSAHECYLYSRRPKTVGTVRRDDGGRNAAASRRATQWKKND